jgi:hypothetical protein
MKIKTNNVQERNNILNIFFSVGAVWHIFSDEFKTADDVERKYPQSKWPIVVLDEDYGLRGCSLVGIGGLETLNAATQMPEILRSIAQLADEGRFKQSVQIKLNDSYTAEVIDKGQRVKVGCQTFDAKVVLDLAKLIKKQQNS